MGDALTHGKNHEIYSKLKKLLKESDINLRKFLNKQMIEYKELYNEKTVETVSEIVFKNDSELIELEKRIEQIKWQIKNTH